MKYLLLNWCKFLCIHRFTLIIYTYVKITFVCTARNAEVVFSLYHWRYPTFLLTGSIPSLYWSVFSQCAYGNFSGNLWGLPWRYLSVMKYRLKFKISTKLWTGSSYFQCRSSFEQFPEQQFFLWSLTELRKVSTKSMISKIEGMACTPVWLITRHIAYCWGWEK